MNLPFTLPDGTFVALLAFGSIALATLSLILLWEGIQRFRRQRQISGEIERLRGSVSGEPGSRLLREPEIVAGPRWLAAVVAHFPRRSDLEHLLDQADLDWSVSTFLALSLGLASAAGLSFSLLTTSTAWALLGAAGGGLLPYGYVRHKRSKRFEAFEQYFPDSIDLLARSMRAGHALRTGIGLIGEEAPDPIKDEFRQMFEEQKFGLPVEESMRALADRIGLMDVRMFVTSVIIQREAGGNLAENLGNLSALIRARFKFRRQLRIHTAQGRMTGYVLAVLPIGLAIVLYAIAPEHMGVLFTDPIGRGMLFIGVVLQIMGFMVIRRIINIEF